MNISKRTFNPLFAQSFRYEQSENSSIKYTGNWGPVIQPLTVSASAWSVISGNAVLGAETFTDALTTVIISGTPGESTIVNKITFSDGQIDERIIKLIIVDNDVPVINDDYGFCY